jgi:hypothetical protein
MTLWLDAARLVAGVNVLVLLALGAVWLPAYRRHGARHTLGLLVVGAFLLLENALWLYLYLFRPAFVGWYVESGTTIQIGMLLLCGLELVALVVLAALTWR